MSPGILRLGNWLRTFSNRPVLVLLWLLLLPGCATPDLRPFADASVAVAAGVNSGGDLAIRPLARTPVWDGTRFVQPDEPNHPAKALQASWELRRNTMDAVMVYSASLAAIAGAADQRKANATELVESVKQLASAVPSFNVGSSAAGDLVIAGLGTLVEIKAWHDLDRAVRAADPAVQLVADALKKDFAALAAEFEGAHRDQIIQKTVALRPVERFYQQLQEARAAQRTRVGSNVAEAATGNELARIDGLIAGAEPELTALRAERRELESSLAHGKEFFSAAVRAVDAWADAHQDLARSFEQNRSPNLALLAVRARELQGLVENLNRNSL